jgi:hypothetical protein
LFLQCGQDREVHAGQDAAPLLYKPDFNPFAQGSGCLAHGLQIDSHILRIQKNDAMEALNAGFGDTFIPR